MSDNTEQPGGGAEPRDPWAPPDSRVPLEKPAGDPRPPAVHDQQTVTSMPAAAGPTPGFGSAPGTGEGQAPGDVPPPPIAPNGPGQAGPPPAGQYGYPAAPSAPYGGYPGYPGYGGQPAWGAAPSNGMGTAAMVLGILAVCLFCVYGIPSLILGTLALIFGIIGRKRAGRGEADNAGQALAGVILGSIGIAIGVLIIGGLIWFFAAHADEFNDDSSYDDTYGTSLVVDDAR